MIIDELLIAMGLKTDDVKKGAKEAESAISSMTSSIVSKLGILSAGAAAALSVFSRFGEYVSQADAMGKLANALDVDIEKMHAWGEAAARAGGSVEGFQGSLQSLTAQLARQATVGTSRAAKMLEGVGIDAGEIGRQRQAFDVMMDLAEKAETMGKQEFFGLGRSLGLDQGTIMLLQQGRAALKEQIRLQKEFGVYTKEDAKLTADWNDRVADFGQVMKSFSAIIFRMVLPAMTKFVEYVNKAVAFLRKHEKFVQAFFIGLAAVITGVLLPALAKMAAAWLANPMTLSIMALVAALAALALVIEDLVVWANGGESALSDFWESLLGSPEEAKKTWEDIQKAAQGFFDKIPEYVKQFDGFFEGISKYNQIIAAPFKVLIEELKNSAGGFENLKAVADGFIKFVETWNKKLTEPIENLITILKQAEISVESFEDITRSFFDFVRSWDSLLTSPIDNFISLLKSAKEVWDNTLGKLEMPSFSFPSLPSFGSEEKPEAAHAEGGIFTTPHVGLVAEKGTEAIIPMSPGKRNRAYDLLSSVASAFGVKEEPPAPIVNVNAPEHTAPAPVVNVNAPEHTAPAPVVDYSPLLDALKAPAPKIDIDGLAEALNIPAPEENEIVLPQMPTIDFGEFAKGFELPPIHAAEALPPNVSNTSTNNTNVDTRINEIKVYTQATDAEAISRDIGGAIDKNWTAQANVGIAG